MLRVYDGFHAVLSASCSLTSYVICAHETDEEPPCSVIAVRHPAELRLHLCGRCFHGVLEDAWWCKLGR